MLLKNNKFEWTWTVQRRGTGKNGKPVGSRVEVERSGRRKTRSGWVTCSGNRQQSEGNHGEWEMEWKSGEEGEWIDSKVSLKDPLSCWYRWFLIWKKRVLNPQILLFKCLRKDLASATWAYLELSSNEINIPFMYLWLLDGFRGFLFLRLLFKMLLSYTMNCVS